ncbi:MAG: F0F1 ATP synthase subunit A [Frankiaceae bacterium]
MSGTTPVTVLAIGEDIKVGVHDQVTFLGLTFNVDTIVATVAAGLILIGIALWMRRSITSGVPGKLQLVFETVTDYVDQQVKQTIGNTAPFVVPLAVTLFFFILLANWLELIPLGEHVHAPTADVNLTYAMAILVIVLVHVTGVRRKGIGGYLKTFTHGPKLLVPLHFLQELIKPLTLALRLFGNIFSGGIMIAMIGLFPAYMLWLPNIAWKLFDMFIGVIQAFIFALLTILYFESVATIEQQDEAVLGRPADPSVEQPV